MAKKEKAKGDRLAGPISHARAVPIGDYGFLSDGEVSALVAPGGSVDWMCVPRFDSPSAFGAILGRHAGTFRIAPLDATVPAARRARWGRPRAPPRARSASLRWPPRSPPPAATSPAR